MSPRSWFRSSRTQLVVLLVLSAVLSGWYFHLSTQQFRSTAFRGDYAALWQSLYTARTTGTSYSSFNASVHEYVGLTDFAEVMHSSKDLDHTHQFSIHAHFYLYPLSWLPGALSPYFLLAFQSVVYGTFVLWLGLIGLRVGAPLWALLLMLAHFAFSPFSVGLILSDFHFDSMAGLAVGAFGYWLLREKPSWWAILTWAVLVAAIKESFVALVFGAGLCFLTSRPPRWAQGGALLLGGVVAFLFLTKFFIPHYSTTGHFMFTGIYGSRLGDSVGSIVGFSLTHPGAFLKELFSEPNSVYLGTLILSFGFTAWFAPEALLLATGFLFINLVSSNSAMKLPWGQYSAVIVCAVHLAAVLGYPRASRFLTKVLGRWGAAAILGIVCLVPFWVDYTRNPLKQHVWTQYFTPAEYEILRSLPKEDRVCADDRMANFVADRRSLYLFPLNLGVCDSIVLSGKESKPWYVPADQWSKIQTYLAENFTAAHDRPGKLTVLKRKPAAAQASDTRKP